MILTLHMHLFCTYKEAVKVKSSTVVKELFLEKLWVNGLWRREMGKNRVKSQNCLLRGKKSHNFDWICGDNPSASIGSITVSAYR